MTGNQFLILLTLAPLVAAPIAGAVARFKPIPVLGAGVAAELVVLVAALLWSQSLQRRALSGPSSHMIAIASGAVDGRRVMSWLVCCAFGALLAGVVLLGHRLWTRSA
ncbi:MAG: hypothetical protein ACREPM_08830 [Gemmatimonadaceae bacterium]